jgi:hypothetical protein
MKFTDAAKYSMIHYHSIYPTLGAFLNHCFLTNGNGMVWTKNGQLVSHGDETRLSELPALERFAAAGGTTGLSVPFEFFYPLGLERIPANIQERINNPSLTSLCEVDPKYSPIFKMPDNVDPEWLDAAILMLVIITQIPLELSSQYNMARREYDGETGDKQIKAKQWLDNATASYVKGYNNTLTFLDQLRKRFPQHQWSNPMPKIVLDPNRPDFKDGAKTWPVNNEPLEDLTDLVAAFEQAIQFAYSVKPKVENPLTISDILMTLTKTLKDRGRDHTHHQIMDSWKIKKFLKDEPKDDDSLVQFLTGQPQPNAHYWFESVVKVVIDDLRSNYKLVRKNKKKSIPYKGYPIGRSNRAGCLDVAENFTAKSLEYELDGQGRDALEVIVGKMVMVTCEQFRRIYVRDFLAAFSTSTYSTKKTSDFDSDEYMDNRHTATEKPQKQAMLDRIKAAVESFVFLGENMTIFPEVPPTMPVVDELSY